MRSTRLTQVAEEEVGGFKLIGSEDEPAAAPAPAAKPTDDIPSRVIVFALQTLAKRTLIAISNLFSLLLAGSAFALWWSVLPQPTILQLVGLGLYAAFVLVLDFARRR